MMISLLSNIVFIAQIQGSALPAEECDSESPVILGVGDVLKASSSSTSSASASTSPISYEAKASNIAFAERQIQRIQKDIENLEFEERQLSRPAETDEKTFIGRLHEEANRLLEEIGGSRQIKMNEGPYPWRATEVNRIIWTKKVALEMWKKLKKRTEDGEFDKTRIARQKIVTSIEFFKVAGLSLVEAGTATTTDGIPQFLGLDPNREIAPSESLRSREHRFQQAAQIAEELTPPSPRYNLMTKFSRIADYRVFEIGLRNRILLDFMIPETEDSSETSSDIRSTNLLLLPQVIFELPPKIQLKIESFIEELPSIEKLLNLTRKLELALEREWKREGRTSGAPDRNSPQFYNLLKSRISSSIPEHLRFTGEERNEIQAAFVNLLRDQMKKKQMKETQEEITTIEAKQKSEELASRAQNFSSASDFLKAVGAAAPWQWRLVESDGKKMLRPVGNASLYAYEPDSQCYAFSCKEHALSSHLSRGLPESEGRVDPEYVYALAVAYTQLGKIPEGIKYDIPKILRQAYQIKLGSLTDKEFQNFYEQGTNHHFVDLLPALEGIPLLTTKENRAFTQHRIPQTFDTKVEGVRIGNLSSLEGEVSADVIMRMLSAGNPALVAINSDHRIFAEDWLEILPEEVAPGQKPTGHVLEVIDFGIEKDPFDLREKPYFLLRDSFTDQKIHYKVAVDNFMTYLHSIYFIDRRPKEIPNKAHKSENNENEDDENESAE